MKPNLKKLIVPVSIGLTIVVLTVLIYSIISSVMSESDDRASIIEKMHNSYGVDDGTSRESESGLVNPVYSYLSQLPSTRKLSEFYKRRQFSGSPPIIPHPVSVVNGKSDCLSCHQSGGFVPRYNAYTPLTPHPEYVNCQQCHVPQVTTANFKKGGINWVSVQPVKIKRAASPGAPPPIPHTLQLRENCLNCHAGPAAVKQIRTSHPERVNCTQCHVPQKSIPLWSRN